MAEFSPTVDAAAEQLGILPVAVEKDYWASEVLRVLQSDFDDDFIFKGGTSLSKGYRLIERFSDDVDVLVLKNDRGRGALNGLMKRMGLKAAEGVGGTATPWGQAESGASGQRDQLPDQTPVFRHHQNVGAAGDGDSWWRGTS
jgi:hypothetical protein